MTSLADELAKGGGAFLKWEVPGTEYTGTITAVDMRQARKFQSNDLDFWDDNSPKMQCVLTLATAYRDPAVEDDDGVRQCSINLWSGQKQALKAACKAAGVPEPKVGQPFTVKHVKGIGNAQAPREFEYTLGPVPSGVGDALGTTEAAVAAQAPLTPENPIQDVTPPAQPAAPAPPAPPAKSAADQAKELLIAGFDHDTVMKETGLNAMQVQAMANLVGAAA